MARPKKEGFDYFSFDVDFFYDKKVRGLKGRLGLNAVLLYIYILAQIYGDKGYYTKADTDLFDAITADLGLSQEFTEQVMKFLFERSMLDGKLFKSDNVITAVGIQERFQLMTKERAKKKTVEVDERIWLLEDKSTLPFIKVTDFENKSRKNPSYSGKNPSYSREKSLKKSKEKESKVNKSKEEEKESASSSVTQYFEKVFGFINVDIEHEIVMFIEQGVELEMMMEAMDIAIRGGHKSWSYIKGILHNKMKNGIYTLADFKISEEKFGRNINRADGRKSKFNNYVDTNETDYAALEEQMLDMMLEDEE